MMVNLFRWAILGEGYGATGNWWVTYGTQAWQSRRAWHSSLGLNQTKPIWSPRTKAMQPYTLPGNSKPVRSHWGGLARERRLRPLSRIRSRWIRWITFLPYSDYNSRRKIILNSVGRQTPSPLDVLPISMMSAYYFTSTN